MDVFAFSFGSTMKRLLLLAQSAMAPLALILILLFVFSCSSSRVFIRDYSPREIYFRISQGEQDKMHSPDGKYLPAKGIVRSLVVFVQFKDDDVEDTHWQLGQLPDWSNQFIASDTVQPFPPKSVTQYFYDMSNGRFFLVGDAYPSLVITKKKHSEYVERNEGYGVFNREVLSEIDKWVNLRNTTIGTCKVNTRSPQDTIVR